MFEWLGLAPDIVAILFAVALVAGFIDTLAGGGGLIALPALLMTGVPPIQALATNKLQGTAGTLTATLMMFRHRRIRWQQARWLMLLAFIGSAVGTVIVQLINTTVLHWVIPIVLVMILVFFITQKIPETGKQVSTKRQRLFRRFAVPVIGGYDGMFGPATGSFFALAGVSLSGRSLIDATALAKCLNFATNVASLLVFAVGGKILWATGLVMIIGQLIGAYIGSHTLYRMNVQVLRWLVVFMCSAMLLRYLWG